MNILKLIKKISLIVAFIIFVILLFKMYNFYDLLISSSNASQKRMVLNDVHSLMIPFVIFGAIGCALTIIDYFTSLIKKD